MAMTIQIIVIGTGLAQVTNQYRSKPDHELKTRFNLHPKLYETFSNKQLLARKARSWRE